VPPAADSNPELAKPSGTQRQPDPVFKGSASYLGQEPALFQDRGLPAAED
jgi:hypothetical protein